MFVFHVFMWLFGCQDVPSFGGFLSRCSIFRQGESFCVCSSVNVWFMWLFGGQDVPSFGGFLSRCSIFRQGESFCVCSSVNVWFLWLFGCQDVPSFGGFLSRCSIFRQGESFCVCSSVNVCVCGSLAVKMFHLSAASCQDAPSLGRESHFVFIRA